MKNITTSAFYAKSLIIGLLALMLAACAGDDPAPPKPTPNPTPGTFIVTFTLNAADAQGQPEAQTVQKSTRATQPKSPTRDGYTFEGWFTDPNYQNAFNFDASITENVILYAKWEQIPEKFWIPDENFRNKLKSLISEAFDADDSLMTQNGRVKTAFFLDVRSSSIADLTGIEYFTALTQLWCFDNQLTSLNVSQNTALESLLCYKNQLTGLDLSHNTALKRLSCSINELKDLDVSHNVALTELSCNDNQLTSLDVSQNAALEVLYCHDNQLTSLNMRGMRSLSPEVIGPLRISASSPLTSLKVHENLKDHAEIKEVKTNRGDALTIETYSAEAGSTDYTLVCADYDPNDGDAGSCKKAAP